MMKQVDGKHDRGPVSVDDRSTFHDSKQHRSQSHDNSYHDEDDMSITGRPDEVGWDHRRVIQNVAGIVIGASTGGVTGSDSDLEDDGPIIAELAPDENT